VPASLPEVSSTTGKQANRLPLSKGSSSRRWSARLPYMWISLAQTSADMVADQNVLGQALARASIAIA
jgi:hypothetical protein